MKISIRCTLIWMLFCLSFAHPGSSTPSTGRSTRQAPPYKKAVNESARRIPVAYDVDVVVVGGTSGGIAAAVEAARNGAKVFLAARPPYLGLDLCATYRLWLENDEIPTSPLAKKLFIEMPAARWMQNAAPFTYRADRQSAGVHPDTAIPSVLNDGKAASASTQSVQYDGNVTIIADLGRVRRLKNVHVLAYQRRSPALADDFEVDSVTISLSSDNRQWKKAAAVKNQRAGEALSQPWGPIALSAPLSDKARYVKVLVKKSEDVKRILLAEIAIETDLSSAGPAKAPPPPPSPMHVKRTFDEALLEAGVDFLFGCYVTDVLTDAKDNVAGIVMANRSGRQAVKAKVVIDATPRATVARIAGAAFAPYPSRPRKFKYVTVGGEIRTAKGVEAREISTPLPTGRRAVEYTLTIPMQDSSFASFARAEQTARDRTWHPEQVDASEVPFEVPPDPIRAKKSLTADWPGAWKVDLDAFRPAAFERLYVLGGCADITRDAAQKLLRPLEFIETGARIGADAAARAKRASNPKNSEVPARRGKSVASGDISENLSGLWRKPNQLGFVTAPQRAVPVLGNYDVVVIGGGTGGAPAGISAARHGAKTLVVEYLHGLGGVGTMGYISKYYYGYLNGFTAEVDPGVAEVSAHGKTTSPAWNPELKKQWYRRELRKAGADIWFGAIGCGAFVEDGRVKGAVVATPDGRGVVLADVVIDSTGNADIAITAGADYIYTDETSPAVQGTGLPPRKMGAGYTNTDWTFVDDSDVVDVWRAFVVAKQKYKDAYDLGQLVDTRERRRIVGDFTMSPMDISLQRTYTDTIVISRSNFDTHGFIVHSLFMVRPPDRKAMLVNVPYRCLLPKGLNGILVTGLGVSAHRDAMPVIRMQADIQNQGYAAGLIAATTARTGKPLREVDIKAIQKQLVEKGNLPETVLTDRDSFPLSMEDVIDAVQSIPNDYKGLEVVLAQPADAMPRVQRAFKDAKDPKARLAYAHVLGMVGDPTGADTLFEAVASAEWDKGWNYTGMGQFGPSQSPLDSLIIALGRTRDKRALKPILDKVNQIDPKSEFSHSRAVALALETLADPAAAKPLAELLNKPGIMGHAFTDIEKAANATPPSATDTKTRNLSLRELILARALYRCGDHKGLGQKILKDYARDLRGHYARHARAVLKEESPKP